MATQSQATMRPALALLAAPDSRAHHALLRDFTTLAVADSATALVFNVQAMQRPVSTALAAPVQMPESVHPAQFALQVLTMQTAVASTTDLAHPVQAIPRPRSTIAPASEQPVELP